MGFVTFWFFLIVYSRTCMGDTSLTEYESSGKYQNTELMKRRDTYEHTNHREALKGDLEAFLHTWRKENMQDHESLKNLFDQRTSCLYKYVAAIEVLIVMNILIIILVGGSTICQTLVKCAVPLKRISLKIIFTRESKKDGSKNSHKTKKTESEDSTVIDNESQHHFTTYDKSGEGQTKVTDQFDANRVANFSEMPQETKIIPFDISSQDNIQDISADDTDDAVKPGDTIAVKEENMQMQDLPGNLIEDGATKHKHTVKATPDGSNESMVASDSENLTEEDSLLSDNTYVKSNVPFRLEHTEVQYDSNNTDQLCQNNETSNNTENYTRKVCTNSIKNLVAMENVTVFVCQKEQRMERRIVTPKGNLQNLCQCCLWNTSVEVKIVLGNSSYVGTVYRYTRLCPNGYCTDIDTNGRIWRGESLPSEDQLVASPVGQNRNQENIQFPERMKINSLSSKESDQQEIKVGSGSISSKEAEVQTSFSEVKGDEQKTVIPNDTEEDGDEMTSDDEDVVDSSIPIQRDIRLHSYTDITADMQAVLRCIDLRVDDVPDPVTNGGGEERNEDYNWPYLNENFEDLPQVESSNRRIYAELRRIDDVLGYFSNGDSIDVFVNLEETNADDILSRICQITGEGPEKFHIKDSEEQWLD